MDKRHIIRLIDHFEYNNHLCLVYECMEMNLRETLNKYGRNIGLSIEGVCLYGRQLFLALSLLHKLKLIHADLKPDNIMVSKDTKKIKLCDFGSCLSVDEAHITEYMVSRFYRAPEIMLGCPFDTAIDVWSAGVSLFELYTGRVMFPGRSNNEMLKLIM
jgi:serine/threonine-protein kinase PRP4